MKDYMKEYEEHLNNITKDVLNEAFESTPLEKKLANYGRILMDQAVTTKDDALSNLMSKVGDQLTNWGTTYGASSLEELVKKTGATPNVIKKMLAFAEKIAQTKGDLKSDNADGGLDDEGDDEFTNPADDEMAAMKADQAARDARR
tara:strand:+ start:382 stop:819 length:438 start_codon:yes stop_codon:yes gene_type:complete